MFYFIMGFLALLLLLTVLLAKLTLKKNRNLITENQVIKAESINKDKTIKEYCHRVKNNFQLINSLLSYQAKEYNNDEIEFFLLKFKKRINSIIILHNNIDISNHNSDINLKKYIKELFDFFSDLFSEENKKIKFHLYIDDIILNAEMALPIGIILNELICNSFLHAFPSKTTENVISVSLKKLKIDSYHLSYEDNGVGFHGKSNNGMGLKIIDLLSNQIRAKYFYESTSGFKFILSFKTTVYNE